MSAAYARIGVTSRDEDLMSRLFLALRRSGKDFTAFVLLEQEAA